MAECSNNINEPIQQQVDNCNGERVSTDCVTSPNPLTELGLPEDATQTEINSALQNALVNVTTGGTSTINSINFDTSTGNFILGRNGLPPLAKNLDGRYSLISHSHSPHIHDNSLTGPVYDGTTSSLWGINPDYTGFTNYYTKTEADSIESAVQSQITTNTDDIGLIESQIPDFQLLNEKGQPHGYASLDGGGQVPISQLPTELVVLKGDWDASTNTPTLSDGIGTVGDCYKVSVAGSQDLGSGTMSFDVDDLIIYKEDNTWFKVSGGFSHQSLTFSNGNLSISNGNTIDLDSRYLYIGGDHITITGNTINHDAGSWVAKTDLSGANVISNLSVDAFGHPTDWATRALTAGDIGAQPAGNYVNVNDNISTLTNDLGYITGYTETDPIFTASPANGITNTDITNWNTALQNGDNISELVNDVGYTANTGTVTSVTGDGVDNTDPQNPTLTFPTATEVDYDNADSGLSATDVKNAIDELNQDIQTMRGSIGPAVSSVLSYKISDQVIPNTALFTELIWETDSYDPFSIRTSPTEFTIPAWATHARITVQSAYIQDSGETLRQMRVRKNGFAPPGCGFADTKSRVDSSAPMRIVSAIIPVSSGDIFTIEVWHSPNATKTIDGGLSWIQIELYENI